MPRGEHEIGHPPEHGEIVRLIDTIERPDGGLTAIHQALDGTTYALDLGPRQNAANDGPQPKETT